ncbi:hypothetical protein RSSM_06033 [Rhodopirellula sallentina SM41]|uniref:Uncharacterized protein n=1 Tax=Rhodopirellula sallentina SM41 TaxID=1263870 RepID=M5U977_9BACT|nr:hypothetical protein RSSM_06033 [Rhodopirellula sallentina SM41]
MQDPQSPLQEAHCPVLQAPLPQAPVEHVPVLQLLQSPAGAAQVEHPPRVLWWRHPVLRAITPSIDPIKSQRFILESLYLAVSCVV